MKTIIAGTRTASRAQTLEALWDCEWTGEITFVITGMESDPKKQRGADLYGIEWAKEHGIPYRTYPPDWTRYGLSAGPRRNTEMAKAAEALIAVWDGKSKGTKDMINKAYNLHRRVFVYRID